MHVVNITVVDGISPVRVAVTLTLVSAVVRVKLLYNESCGKAS